MGDLGRRRVMSGILMALAGAGGGRLLTVGDGGTEYGYASGLYGDLTPREFLSAVIVQLSWTTSNSLILWVSNSALPNSGWSSLNISGTVFLRTSASYASGVWTWSGVSSNPIGTSGTIPVNIA
jgi:hypothetical protein